MFSKVFAIVQKLKNKSQLINVNNFLVEKPWTLIDDNGSVQRLIFRSNKELILSIDGNVQIGSWDCYPEAKCILIDRVVDKILCSELYADDTVIVLKKDGLNNELFILANANMLPSLDILGYLSSKLFENDSVEKIITIEESLTKSEINKVASLKSILKVGHVIAKAIGSGDISIMSESYYNKWISYYGESSIMIIAKAI